MSNKAKETEKESSKKDFKKRRSEKKATSDKVKRLIVDIIMAK